MTKEEFEAHLLMLGFGYVGKHPIAVPKDTQLGQYLQLHPNDPVVLEMDNPAVSSAPHIWGRWTAAGAGNVYAPEVYHGAQGGVFFASRFPDHLTRIRSLLEQKKPG